MEDNKAVSSKKAKSEDEESIWDLGNNRQVNVRNFKGNLYVDIREMYYDKDGDLKPGKKGNLIFSKHYFFNTLQLIISLSITKNNILYKKINISMFNLNYLSGSYRYMFIHATVAKVHVSCGRGG